MEQPLAENEEKTLKPEEPAENAPPVQDSNGEPQPIAQNIPDWQTQYNDLNDKYLRLYSEFENFRRRNAKERIEIYKSAGEEIVKSLLPVLDDFERAIKSTAETVDISVLKEGILLVYNKFKTTLEQNGLESRDAKGEVFDTHWHEALTSLPAAEKKDKGKVVEVIEKGYLFNGRIIRHAKVVVGE